MKGDSIKRVSFLKDDSAVFQSYRRQIIEKQNMKYEYYYKTLKSVLSLGYHKIKGVLEPPR